MSHKNILIGWVHTHTHLAGFGHGCTARSGPERIGEVKSIGMTVAVGDDGRWREVHAIVCVCGRGTLGAGVHGVWGVQHICYIAQGEGGRERGWRGRTTPKRMCC